MNKIIYLIAVFLFLLSSSFASEKICVMFFYGEGCPACSQVEPFIKEIESKYSATVEIHYLELYKNLNNYQLYSKFCGIQQIPVEQRKIPMVAVGSEIYIGVPQIKENLEQKINQMIITGERQCPLPDVCPQHMNITDGTSPVIPDITGKVTLPLVLMAGLVDGINPCAFAVLIFLLTFLIEVSSNRKRMIKAGTAYIISVYATYFLAGFGILSIIQVSGLSNIITKIAAGIAIIAGIINIKDYFWYGKGFSLKIPESKKGVIVSLTKKANVPAAVVLGFLVSMFELPCTGGIYLAILAMIAGSLSRIQSIFYLSVYNFMFILPLFIILGLISIGMETERIESWRTSKKNWMRLVMGCVLLGLGVMMVVK